MLTILNTLYNKLHNKLPTNIKPIHTSFIILATRNEQKLLRLYLTNTKKHQCIICTKKLPLCLLDAAHLKPRYLITSTYERRNVHNVEFMCKCCHSLYDNGLISVKKGVFVKSTILDNILFDLDFSQSSTSNIESIP
jgi:hypothetical protein